jgi:hypothetical protein
MENDKFILQERDVWEKTPVIIGSQQLTENQVYLLQLAIRDYTKKMYAYQNINNFTELSIIQQLLGMADIEMEAEMPGNIHSVHINGKIDID